MAEPKQIGGLTCPQQQRGLELIYETFAAAADWPTFQHVGSLIWEEMKLEARDIYHALSASELVNPIVTPERGFNLRNDTRVQVSLRGAMFLPGASEDIVRFLASVRFIAERASSFRPSNPTEAEAVLITSEEIRSVLELPEGDPALLRQGVLIRDQVRYSKDSFFGPDPNDGSWSLGVEVELARRFTDVWTIPAFLELEETIRIEGSRPWGGGPIAGEIATIEEDAGWFPQVEADEKSPAIAKDEEDLQARESPQVTQFVASEPEVERHDVFISHASEDKEAVARPLAKRLRELGYRVWYDEFQLKVGMSLRRSIDKGLTGSRFGVVILSPSFFAKEWPQRELDGLVAREASGEPGRILPVWHEVDRDAVASYSPTLADRVAAQTRDGLDVLVERLAEAIGPPDAGSAGAADTSGLAGSAQLGPIPATLELSPLPVEQPGLAHARQRP